MEHNGWNTALECVGTGLGLMLTALFFWGFWIATP
jgi:hypothetical protein